MFIYYLYVYLLLEKCLFYPFVHFKIVLSSKHWTDKQLKNSLAPSLLSKYIFKYFYSVCIFFKLFSLIVHAGVCVHARAWVRTLMCRSENSFQELVLFHHVSSRVELRQPSWQKAFSVHWVLSPCLFWFCWWCPLKYECFQFLTYCLWLWCY